MSSSTLPAPSVVATASDARTVDPEGIDELLVRVAASDRTAYEAVYRLITPHVLATVRGVLRDPSLSEEVTQEVMLEIWRKASTFDPGRGGWRGWVSTLARRRAVDRVRSEQASRDRNDRVARRDDEQPADVVVEEVERRLEHWQVREALAHLTERQREAIDLAYFAGHTYRDVAEVLGIPEGTAKSRLRDGLLRLREALADLA